MAMQCCPLRELAIAEPGKPTLQIDGESITASELDGWVENIAVHFRRQGVGEGDRILVPVTDTLSALLILLACIRCQWVYCPLNPGMPDQNKKEYSNSIGSRWTVGMPMPDTVELKLPPRTGGVGAVEKHSVMIDPSRSCDLIPTAGTTGTPKAIAHTFANHCYSAEGARTAMILNEHHRWLLSLPLFHVGGYAIVIRCLLAGAVMVVERQKRSFEQLLVSSGITHLSLVNTQLYRLLGEVSDLSVTDVSCLLLGGGYVSPDLVGKARSQGVNTLTTYGLTEMSSQVCTGAPTLSNGVLTSGQLLPHRELSITADGEILVRGETLSPGRFHHGQLTSLANEQGWYSTGDLGHWADDQLCITGRLDNMMISGGENIHPEEIERALLEMENICQAVVVAVKNREFGERPFAFVHTHSGELDERAIRDWLLQRLPRFKVPDDIHQMPNYGETTVLKIDRHRLAACAEEHLHLK